jgi:hypothetical protein
MVWFRVDDNLSDHPKVLAAGNAAMGLWVRAGAWSMKHLTDGYVPDAVAQLLGSVKETQALVSSGLWLVAEGGYMFHAWEGRQPTREAVERDRDAAAERQKRAREKARESRRDESVTEGVSNGPPVPSRPVPIEKTDIARAPKSSLVGDGAASKAEITDVVYGMLVKAAGPMSRAGAEELAAALCARARRPVDDVNAYVATVCHKSPSRVVHDYERLDLEVTAA